MRKLGINVDVIAKDKDVSNYKLVVAPGLMQVPLSLQQHHGLKVFGPRTGAKTADFAIPDRLPPELEGFDCTVTRVESLRPDMPILLKIGGHVQHGFETLETTANVVLQTSAGAPAVMRSANTVYLAGQLDPETLRSLFQGWLEETGIESGSMPEGVRQRMTGLHRFIFNYSESEQTLDAHRIHAASVLIEARG